MARKGLHTRKEMAMAKERNNARTALPAATAMSAIAAVVAAGVLATLIAFALSLSLSASQAYAGGGRISVGDFKGTTTTELGRYESYNYYAKKGTVKKVKSSNKKVATASVKGNYLVVKPKGVGTATISFKYKGKSRKAKIKVYAYENPAALFKVGSQDYTSYYNDGRMMNGNATGKVQIKPAAGWKIKGIETVSLKTYKTKKVKNGFNLKKNTSVYVSLYNKSKKLYSSISFYNGF